MPNPTFAPPTPIGGEGAELQLARQGAAVGAGISLVFAAFHAVVGFHVLMWISLLAAVVNGVAVGLTLRNRLALARTTILAGLAVVVAGISTFTGGLQSAALLWALILPVVATVGVSPPLVRITAAFSAVFVLAFFLAELTGALPPSLLDPQLEPWFLLGTLLSLLASIAMVQSNALKRRLDFEAERERALADLELARERAEAANLAKTRFVSHMSHEIRTPLNGVLGLAQLLRESPLNREQTEQVEMLLQSGEALLGVINEVLDFSKIEADRVEFESLPYSPASLVVDAALLFSSSAAQSGIELVVDVSSGIPAFAHGDALRVRQVLTNLVGNAVKFTAAGTVKVTATAADEGAGPPVLRVAVSDTGVGIPAEALQNLFEPFTQADATTTRRFGGTGLGLAICKRLLDRMGGKLSVQSTEGEGSTFTLTVPLHSAAPPSRVAQDLQGATVLLVEDHVQARAVTEHLLAAGGARVVACSRSEAAARLRAGGFSALVYGQPASADDGALPGELAALGYGGPMLVLVPRPHATLRAWARERPNAALLAKPPRAGAFREALVAELNGGRGQAAQSPSLVAPPQVRARVLVAEDNSVNLAVVSGMLHRFGCEVVTASTGVEAVQAASAGDVDLVLMDCQMPELDGLEATRRIRAAEGAGRHTPILALTANVLPEQRMACLAAGMDDCVAKPLRTAELDRALSNWVKLEAPDSQAVLAELDPTSAQAVVALFRSDAPVQVQSLLQALELGDVHAAVRLAHGMKSAAGALGLAELAAVSLRLESELPGAEPDAHEALAMAFSQAVARALRSLNRWSESRAQDAALG